MTSRRLLRSDDLRAVALDDKSVIEQKVCPHMVHPGRCGLCLREKHFKKINEEMTESGRSDFSSIVKGEMTLPDLTQVEIPSSAISGCMR